MRCEIVWTAFMQPFDLRMVSRQIDHMCMQESLHASPSLPSVRWARVVAMSGRKVASICFRRNPTNERTIRRARLAIMASSLIK